MSSSVKMDLFLARCKLCGNTIDCYCAKALMHNRFRMRHKGGNMSKIINFAQRLAMQEGAHEKQHPKTDDCFRLLGIVHRTRGITTWNPRRIR